MRIKSIAIIIILLLTATNAIALTGRDDGYAWHRASIKEKNALIQDAVRRIGANYPSSEMKACLDAYYKKPAPPYILQQPLSDIIALCHAGLH